MQHLIQTRDINRLLYECLRQTVGCADIGIGGREDDAWRMRQRMSRAGQVEATHTGHPNITDQKLKIRFL